MSFWRFSSHLGKKGREQFSAEKKRNIYGGNGFRNIKKMAGINFPIGIGNQTGKIDSKKGPETGIPRNSGGIPAEFPTKVPNPWISHDEFRNKREEARRETTLASSSQQLAQLLGECKNSPCILTHPPERDDRDIPQPPSFDWPNDLIRRIRTVMSSSCPTPSPPEFSFEFTDEGARHNLEVLKKYDKTSMMHLPLAIIKVHRRSRNCLRSSSGRTLSMGTASPSLLTASDSSQAFAWRR